MVLLVDGIFRVHGGRGSRPVLADAGNLQERGAEEDAGLATLDVEAVRDLPNHLLEKK